jgi:hypothetical protein
MSRCPLRSGTPLALPRDPDQAGQTKRGPEDGADKGKYTEHRAAVAEGGQRQPKENDQA